MVGDILENIFMQSLRNASHLFFLCSSGLSDNQEELCVLPCWPVSNVIKALFMHLAKWKDLSRAYDRLAAAIDNNTSYSTYIRLYQW
mgnify:CR=1 FL=1